MENITSSQKRRPRKGKRSYKPAPEKLRPLNYKTAMGLGFEALAASMGLGDNVEAPTIRTATWVGTR